MSTPITNAITAAATDVVVNELNGKKWYTSKTVWANLIIAGSLVAQLRWGFVVSAEYQALALAAINMVLRKVTNQPIVF